MKNLKFIFLIAFSLYATTDKTLFIDTGCNHAYYYQTFLSYLKHAGLRSDFQQLPTLDLDILSSSKSIILSVDGAIISGLGHQMRTKKRIDHPLLKKFIALLHRLRNQRDTVITLLLPNSFGNIPALIKSSVALFKELGCINPENKNLRDFLNYILQPDIIKAEHYNCSLMTRKKEEPFLLNPIKPELRGTQLMNGAIGVQTHPIAFYNVDSSRNNKIFIAKTSMITFNDIHENFFYNPMNRNLRRNLLAELYGLTRQIVRAAQGKKIRYAFEQEDLYLPDRWKRIANPTYYAAESAKVAPFYNWIEQEKIWLGWGNIEAYKGKELEAAENILKSGLNALWFELTPETYLSKRAIKKDKKEEFFGQIKAFTKALKEAGKKFHKTIPKFFAGTDITLNFRTASVKHPVKDIFGKTYSKIPSALDREFWHDEVIDVFNKFVDEWQTVGNGIPLTGLFLDLEMYHAQDQTGQYTNFMDFSDYAWNLYTEKRKYLNLKKLETAEARADYLLKHAKLTDYFSFLENEAYEIGKMIKYTVKKRLPQGIIGVYNITLPHCWFYDGILRGLSLKAEPIILATFNNEFYKHKAWLEQKKIYAYHLQAMLLSKFQKQEDFGLIPYHAKDHDGVWFNRISRWEQKFEKDSWKKNPEISPLDTKTLINGIVKELEKFSLNPL